MKVIYSLLRRQFAENKTIIALFVAVYIATICLFVYAELNDSLDYYRSALLENKRIEVQGEGFQHYLNDLREIYFRMANSVFEVVVAISLCALAIGVHWGIRHFTYSRQSYHYNTLPLSRTHITAFMILWSLLLLPSLFFGLSYACIYILYSLRLPADLGLASPGNFADDVAYSNGGTAALLTVLPFVIVTIIILATFFNRMGFIKTAVATFLLFFLVMLSCSIYKIYPDTMVSKYVNLQGKSFANHTVILSVLFLGMIVTIRQRLIDKNY